MASLIVNKEKEQFVQDMYSVMINANACHCRLTLNEHIPALTTANDNNRFDYRCHYYNYSLANCSGFLRDLLEYDTRSLIYTSYLEKTATAQDIIDSLNCIIANCVFRKKDA